MSQNTYSSKLKDSGSNANMVQRLLVFTPTRGTVRMEWVVSRYNQIIPTNWSKTDMIQYLSSYIPIRFTVADAQNLAVHEAISKGFEWLLMIEDDTMPPSDALLRFTEYMDKGDVPVVSGLYFTRSVPPEPMVYRGRGNHYFRDWKLGDKVWVDGAPTGMLLINTELLKAVAKDCADYRTPDGTVLKRVFETPSRTWFNEATGAQETLIGTSDLDFCNRIVKGDYLKPWPKVYLKKGKKNPYPLLIDTNIYARHIDDDGTQFPINFPQEFVPDV